MLSGAEQLFIERGYAHVSVSDICEAAGFTRGAFYSNFADKDDIMLALFDQNAQRRLDQLQALLTEAPARDISAWADALLAVTPEDRGFILLFLEFRLHAARHPELAAKLDQHDDTITEALAELLKKQPWAQRFPAQALARTLLAAREGILARTARADLSADNMLQAITAVISEGVGALEADSQRST